MKRRIPPRRDPESVSEWGRERSYTLIVAVSVAVIAYAALWILAGAVVNSKSERNLDRHAQECAEYIAHIVNEHKAEDDVGRAVDEIKTMAYSLSARIVIVDTDYKVVRGLLWKRHRKISGG